MFTTSCGDTEGRSLDLFFDDLLYANDESKFASSNEEEEEQETEEEDEE
jgi:hypothetical protein